MAGTDRGLTSTIKNLTSPRPSSSSSTNCNLRSNSSIKMIILLLPPIRLTPLLDCQIILRSFLRTSRAQTNLNKKTLRGWESLLWEGRFVAIICQRSKSRPFKMKILHHKGYLLTGWKRNLIKQKKKWLYS